MNDALNLARAGLLDYDTAFHLTEYLKFENDYLPWEATLTALKYIDSMMWQKPGYDLLQVNRVNFYMARKMGMVFSFYRNTSVRFCREFSSRWDSAKRPRILP